MIEIVNYPSREQWENLCTRSIENDTSLESSVKGIIEEVKVGGDEALIRLTREYDKTESDSLQATKEEIEAACAEVPDSLKDAISVSAKNIRKFHEVQLPVTLTVETSDEVICRQEPRPIEKVGLYIPGGTAPLFSTVLMLAIPASIAGCKKVVLCTPPDRKGKIAPAILYAASVCGITEIYKCGGAQAIAAMAYGTETILRVDKIFGPGNRFVTTAKQIVSQDRVAIDMPAGPSEVMVLADETAVPAFIAADLLSQAEHGNDSQSLLVTNSELLASEVRRELKVQLDSINRKDFASSSLDRSSIVLLRDVDSMVEFCNLYAAEHLIISMKNDEDICSRITNAGSIFLGNYSPESAGDYSTGTNHTLPTAGWARSYCGVNTESFLKKVTIQKLTEKGLAGIAPTVIEMATAEGLDAHANAVRVRINQR